MQQIATHCTAARILRSRHPSDGGAHLHGFCYIARAGIGGVGEWNNAGKLQCPWDLGRNELSPVDNRLPPEVIRQALGERREDARVNYIRTISRSQ